jgi:hypothetical protein
MAWRLNALWALLLVGCGPAERVTVRTDPAAYAKLPDTDRAKVAMRDEGELVRAQQEEQRAVEELAAARKAVETAEPEKRAAVEVTRKAHADLDEANRSGEPRKVEQASVDVKVGEEGEKVVEAKAVWLAAQVAWREAAREAAAARVASSDAKVELARAELLASKAPADLPYDLAPFRGQHGRLRKSWSDATLKVATAHAEVDRAAGALNAAKTKYAEAKRVVLPKPVVKAQAPGGMAPAPAAATPAPAPAPAAR